MSNLVHEEIKVEVEGLNLNEIKGSVDIVVKLWDMGYYNDVNLIISELREFKDVLYVRQFMNEFKTQLIN